jgi:hypothetical protein
VVIVGEASTTVQNHVPAVEEVSTANLNRGMLVRAYGPAKT